MATKPVKYWLVNAFTESPFKGNPAAVCLLEEEREEKWMQAVATEFNISETCYLTRIAEFESSDISLNGASTARFRLRWFTPVTECHQSFLVCGNGKKQDTKDDFQQQEQEAAEWTWEGHLTRNLKMELAKMRNWKMGDSTKIH